MDLDSFQFEFEGIVFGYGAVVAVADGGFDPGDDDAAYQDAINGFTDSVSFGEDSVSPANWSWQLFTADARDDAEALSDMSALGRKWRDPAFRRAVGEVRPLRYGLSGRKRVVYGRPRHFANALDNGITYGLINATAEFARADTYFYDDEVFSVGVMIQPQTSLGLISPLVSPITTLVQETSIQGVIVPFDGDIPAPFEAKFFGPVVNPQVSMPGWEIQLLITIAAGDSVSVSTYPWGARATRSDGADVSGYLTANSRLSKARLDPAGGYARFNGIDSSGTATCIISWRPTYSTI